MASRYNNPDIQYFTADGTTPLAGGRLFFYTSGTSSKLNTYSDSGLTIANANPVILDSSGRAGPIFLQNLKYKVLLCPSTDSDPPTSPIWTQDPVYTSDYSTTAQFFSGSGNPNGLVAGTQGSATTSASVYWDYTNNILYVCTTTGNAASAVWTAVNAATAAAVVPEPQGYLTPTSGTPIILSDVTAATTVYYTPLKGLLVPIYNGTTMQPTSIITELQYTLTASLAGNNIYDHYIFSNSGVATLGSGPSWSAGTGGSITAGSCARGTGAGGAALTRVQGLWTNAVSMTIRYGDGTQTATVAPNQATYVGSIFMDGTNGQVSCHRSYGQSRKWGIWNAYNRYPLYLKAGDATGSWNYQTNSLQAANANSANSLTVFSGLPEEIYGLRYVQKVGMAAAASNAITMQIGLGLNSTTVATGYSPGSVGFSTAANFNDIIQMNAEYLSAPSLGINVITALTAAATSASVITWFGSESQMVLSAGWRG